MNIDELREQIPDETSCRQFFEKLIWAQGRLCPHCQCTRPYALRGLSSRPGLYECARCKRQFTVTTQTLRQTEHSGGRSKTRSCFSAAGKNGQDRHHYACGGRRDGPQLGMTGKHYVFHQADEGASGIHRTACHCNLF